jgi:hypothetical protein
MINGMKMGSQSFQKVSTGGIANLPCQVKGFDCFCRIHFEWYRQQIYHAYSP